MCSPAIASGSDPRHGWLGDRVGPIQPGAQVASLRQNDIRKGSFHRVGMVSFLQLISRIRPSAFEHREAGHGQLSLRLWALEVGVKDALKPH